MSQKVEVVFSFDTTGSMAPCLRQVRGKIEGALAPLFKEIADLRIGLVAHGDYCDARTYVTKWQHLTNNLHDLSKFVMETPSTGGGDADECYELVLHEARAAGWSADARKILVVLGDANPHAASYSMNTKRLDWRAEAKALADIGVEVYGVQCLPRSYNAQFYKEISAITGGYYLTLDQFQEVVELIKAIVIRQHGEEQFKSYEKSLVDAGKMTRSLDKTFSILSGRPIAEIYSKAPTERIGGVVTELTPVPAGRFQTLKVGENTDIKGFVLANDLEFKTGRGFYEFTKREEVQEKKEVILRDKVTGDMFQGDQARNILGLPKGTRGNVSPDKFGKYQVFIQSTSYNRKLIAGTTFLYEVDYDR